MADSDDDDDGSTSGQDIMSVSQEIYTRSNSNKKQLYLLCLGLFDRTGDPLFDLEAPIWRRASKRRELKPTRPELAHEVHRRDQSQKCANWPLQRSVDFLLTNPITNPADISFLRSEVDRLKLLIIQVQQEDVEGGAGGSAWRGHAPYMRLIMCLTCDDVKAAFRRSGDVMSRQQLDARNSEARPPTAFELMAARWNDPSFNPMARPSDCHIDFIDQTDCSYRTVSSLAKATALKVKDYFVSFRLSLLRIIRKWEQSGQGDGGHRGEEDDQERSDDSERQGEETRRFGALMERPAAALESRASFLQGRPSYLLYFWELADEHQILQTAMNRFDEDSGASDASSTPSVVSQGARVRAQDRRRVSAAAATNAVSADAKTIAESLRAIAQAEVLRTETFITDKAADRRRMRITEDGVNSRSIRRRIEKLKDQRREYRRLVAESEDPTSTRAVFYAAEVIEIGDEIVTLQGELITTPPTNNRTPPDT
jgi:hypothetical protein